MEVILCNLLIRGKAIPQKDLHEYSIQFTQSDRLVVLYHKGRRVTEPWKLRMNVTSPPDEFGSSG